MLIPALGASQNPQFPDKTFETKRCTPKIVKQGDLPKDMSPLVQRGDKSTGYTPLVSFQILESGKVACRYSNPLELIVRTGALRTTHSCTPPTS